MNRRQEIELRLAAIRQELENEGADLDALEEEVRTLTAERDRIDAAAEKRNRLRSQVAAGAGEELRSFSDLSSMGGREETFTAASQEYRTAWLKNIAVDERGNHMFGAMNDAEKRAFTFLTSNTSAVVPTDIINRIVELVNSEAPMLADATPNSFTRGFGIPRHKAIDAGDAAATNEGEANEDEQDSFDLLDLAGVEIKKHVKMSRKMEIQSLSAFESWLTTHLADRIRVAKEKLIHTRLDDTKLGIDAGNIISGTLSDAEVRKIFSLIDQNGTKVVYANNATIWNVIAGLEDKEGRKLFIPSTMNDPKVAGRIYGAAVKEDNNLADNILYVGVPKSIQTNDFSALEIVPAVEPTTLKRIFTAYSLFDAGLENPKAMVKYTHSVG